MVTYLDIVPKTLDLGMLSLVVAAASGTAMTKLAPTFENRREALRRSAILV